MAIVLDAAYNGDSTSNASSLTYSHTCTGSNLILFVGAQAYVSGVGSTGDIITGITYNGVSMTIIDKQNGAGAYNRYQYLYYLLNPSTGANNVVISASSSSFRLVASSISYGGVKQSGQPDAHVPNQTASAASLTTALNTIADNCWMVSFATTPLITGSAGAGVTDRANASTFAARMGDSNAPITPASSYSMTWQGGTSPYNVLQASFSPALGGASGYRALLGVGQ